MSEWFERVIRRQPAPLPPNATREALIAEVLERPDDDAPRWVMADWYAQQGDPRGQFIAVQLTLAAVDDPVRRAELVAREAELLARHKADWVGRFKGARIEYGLPERSFVKGNPTHWTFARGFVDTVKMATADFAPNARELLTTEPVRVVQLTQARGRLAAFLDTCPELERVRGLDLSRAKLDEPDLLALFGCPRLTALETLDLTLCGIGMRRGARVFGSVTGRFPRLHTLMLGSNELGDAGVAALAGNPLLDTLKTLALGYDKFGPVGVDALLTPGRLPRLTDLRVPGNDFGPDDERRLA
jgi:uncharacterized protein (TIGR02996 family)